MGIASNLRGIFRGEERESVLTTYTGDERIIVRIDNKHPVSLYDLSHAMSAFSRQFHLFVENETEKGIGIESDLHVLEIRKGSLLFELVSQGIGVTPVLWEGGALSEWFKTLKLILESVVDGKLPSGRGFSKRDYQDFNAILEPIAKDPGANLMVWYQAKFDAQSGTGNRAVIDDICG